MFWGNLYNFGGGLSPLSPLVASIVEDGAHTFLWEHILCELVCALSCEQRKTFLTFFEKKGLISNYSYCLVVTIGEGIID